MLLIYTVFGKRYRIHDSEILLLSITSDFDSSSCLGAMFDIGIASALAVRHGDRVRSVKVSGTVTGSGRSPYGPDGTAGAGPKVEG